MPAAPVEPSLFDLVIKWAEDIDTATDLERALRRSSPLLTFCQNFFAQFFQNVLQQEITSFDMDAKRAAVRLRRGLGKSGDTGGSIPLVAWFERLCDIYPDVLALGYGAPIGGYRSFYDSYMKTLLTRVVVWTRGLHTYPELADRAQASLTVFTAALKRAPK